MQNIVENRKLKVMPGQDNWHNCLKKKKGANHKIRYILVFYNYFTSLLHIDFFVFGSGDADPVPYAM